jgi:FtsH-binding integral membrane protein
MIDIINESVAGKFMQIIYKFFDIALISLTVAACIILYTVGLDHANLGYERRWTYPLFFALLPAFCLRACLRYLFKKRI